KTGVTDHGGKAQLGEAIDERTKERSRRFVQRVQGVRGTALYGHEDRPKSQMVLRPGRMEGNENHSRLVADRLCGDQATCRTRSGRIRRPGWHRVPLVRPRASKRHQTKCE